MARWEPGAAERLQKAALELFTSQGYEQTTAAEIAQAAGLTQRTFFRHFGDKRDVLFHGQDLFVQAFLAGVDAAPAGAPPMQLIASALASASSLFTNERRPQSLMRQSVIDKNQALQERERHKLAGLALEVADALRARGISDPAATLAAESCTTVFSIAFAHWIGESGPRSLAATAERVLNELLALSVSNYDAHVTTLKSSPGTHAPDPTTPVVGVGDAGLVGGGLERTPGGWGPSKREI